MSRPRAPLFRPDGTLKYITFLRASGARPDVLFVSYTVSGRRLATSLSTHRADFRGVYRRAVNVLVEGLGLAEDAALVERMHASVDAFIAAHGLRLMRVSYMQAFAPSRPPAHP